MFDDNTLLIIPNNEDRIVKVIREGEYAHTTTMGLGIQSYKQPEKEPHEYLDGVIEIDETEAWLAKHYPPEFLRRMNEKGIYLDPNKEYGMYNPEEGDTDE